MSLIAILIALMFVAGWIFLLKYVKNKAMDPGLEGEEFRTGKPPAWRVIIYAVIAITIPLYFFYPKLGELSMPVKFAFWFFLIFICFTVLSAGIIFPRLLKKFKTASIKQKKMIINLLIIVSMIAALAKFLMIFYK